MYAIRSYYDFSSSGVIKDYPKSSNSLNIVRLNGEKYFDEHTLSAQLGYRRNVVYQYGFKPTDFETFINEDDLKQRFSRINGSVGFKSNYSEKDKLNHRITSYNVCYTKLLRNSLMVHRARLAEICPING